MLACEFGRSIHSLYKNGSGGVYRVPHGGHGAVVRRMNQGLGPRNSNTEHFTIWLSPLGQ